MLIKIEMGPAYHRTVAELGKFGAQIAEATARGLKIGGQLAAGRVQTEHLSGQALKARTGLLRKAVTSWMAAEHEVIIGVPENSPVGKYSWLLGDEVKTITPQRAKFLAIPIGEGLTPAGVARFASPRDVEGGFFVQSGGQLLFGVKRGQRGKFRPLFVLKKSVTIEGSGALADGVMDSLDDISGAMEDEIGKIKDVD